MLYSNSQDNRIAADNDFFSACSISLRTIIIYTLSTLISLTVLSYRALLGTIRLTFKYSTRIIFYSLLAIALVSAILLLSSIYVITLGTLHFP
ncbi:hypothetical protein [Desulfotalea psychrophila]|uniref:Uncharacterized protein n=1 Tax=Desulfotalea psychrophila (strain LSv54 / DSM 12343) TaxID=177439 RepID=Q6AIJ5_DESPS|nr:hypothetical protein [Desulfotalea psychrophila]CAG37835.1 unknown protein [Desulfotalea psychrophila LSv54]